MSPQGLLSFEIVIETSKVYHSRKDYNFIDLLGDIGGIQTMLMGVFAFIFFNISEFNMFIDLFNRMFKLRDDDALLLFDHDGIDKSKISKSALQRSFNNKMLKA